MKAALKLFLFGSLAIAIGCSSSTPKDDEKADSPSSSTTESSSNVSADGKSSSPKVTIPEELMTEGVLAMGAPFDSAIVYQSKGMPTGDEETKRTFKVEKTDDGNYRLVSRWSGKLGIVGNEVYNITKDGLIAAEALGSEVKPTYVYLPAKIEVGKSWKFNFSLEAAQVVGTMKVTQTSKILGTEEVTVPMGTYTAYVLLETASHTGKDRKGTSTSRTWLVSGVGIVKAEHTSKGTQPDQSGKTMNYDYKMTLEAVRTEKGD